MKRRRANPSAIYLTVLLDLNLFKRVQSYREWQHVRETAFPSGLRFLQYALPERYGTVAAFRNSLQVFAGYSLFLNAFQPDIRFPLHIAIVEGKLKIVSRWIACCGLHWVTPDAFFLAARYNHVHIMEWLVDRKFVRLKTRVRQRARELAAIHGHKPVLSFLSRDRQYKK
ncbi:hypothetical protein AC1031_020425 [Aphanomyces cochlioides]|nr:hypothetical protein AC1031_020425 [Aphanomyces cochlioides]